MLEFLKRFRKGKTSYQSPPVGYLNPHSTLGELDLHLISEGRHETLWRTLGAQVRRDGSGALIGTAFSVWAPNAKSVCLISDHNFWDRKSNPMIPLGPSGVWEIFIPDVGPGLKYKFAIQHQSGKWIDHADPLARATEVPPLTASIVDESKYLWRDESWLTTRKSFQPWKSPISIYEIHLGSFTYLINSPASSR